MRFAQSENIVYPHAFSTRIGGFSTLDYTAGLNLVYGRGDGAVTVDKNRALFSRVTGISFDSLVEASQVHSARVVTVGDELPPPDIEADGFVTNRAGVTLCIKTADCAPVLMCDPLAGVIGACHAGWRGTVAGICANTVEAMCALGAKKENIRVAIGACIHPCCYEVGGDFYSEVTKARGEDFAARHIKARGESIYADIVGMNLELLECAGIKRENICADPHCTCCEPDVYFSHRASGGRRGTMAAIISKDLENEK